MKRASICLSKVCSFLKCKSSATSLFYPEINNTPFLSSCFLYLIGTLLIFQTIGITTAFAAEPAGNALPSNAGYTGLLDMPTARLIPDWNMRFYYTWADPYGTFGATVGAMPWLEVNGRFTGISDLPTSLGSDYGDYKDKAIDVKLRLLQETDNLPALALGAADILGTGIFHSRYLVASKLVGPLDFTFGLGQGILAGEKTSGWDSSGTSFFGGGELLLTEKLSLLAEYSSLDYSNMFGLTEVSKPGDSQWNFGLRYQPWKGGLVSLSYMRGEYFGGALSQSFAFKPQGILPWKPQPFWSAGSELKERARQASNEELAQIVREEIVAERFSNVRASVSDRSIWLEIENPTYLSNDKAIGRACRALVSFLPERIDWLYISLKSRDLIMLTVKMNREDFEAFLDNRLDAETLLEFSTMESDGSETREAFLRQEPQASPLTEAGGSKRLLYGIKPSWQTLVNDPSGFWKNKVSLLFFGSYYAWPGGFFDAAFRLTLYNDISTSNEVDEDDAVRTDSIDYLADSDPRLDVLAYDQTFDLPHSMLGRFAAGYFESEYGGFGAELFRFFGDGRWGIGLESELVWKRDIDKNFGFVDSTSYTTGFLNLYYRLFPEYGVDVGLKIGRFLAGDRGVRIDVSRTYRYFTLGAWYTYTDTDNFTNPINQDYQDKGVYLTVPFSIFKDRDVPDKLYYSMRPWTRDQGQTVSQPGFLYPMAERGNIDSFKRHIEEMKQ
jgi:hypothetical protein